MNEADIKRTLRIIKKAFLMFCSFVSDFDKRNQSSFSKPLDENFDISAKAIFLQMLIFQLVEKFEQVKIYENQPAQKATSIYQYWADFTKTLKKTKAKSWVFPQNLLIIFTSQKKFLNNSQFKQLNDFFAEGISVSNCQNGCDAAYLLAYSFEAILDISFAKGKNLSIQNSALSKKNGVFYTPSAIVKYTVELAFKDFFQRVRNLSAETQIQRVQELKICDPAVGSGLFLIEAMNYLKNYAYNFTSQNDEKNPQIDIPQLIENSFYGVDINPLAVEITKLNLVFICPSEKLNLATIKNHVKCGDSIVGADVNLILHKPVKRRINEKTCRAKEFSQEISDIKKIKRLPMKKQHRILDFWLLLWFCKVKDEAEFHNLVNTFLSIIKTPQRSFDERKKTSELEFDEMLAKIFESHPFFHWQLEFPEVFSNAGGKGFDIIISNPPYRSYYSRHSGKEADDSEDFENFVAVIHSEIDGMKALTDRINFFLLFIIQSTKLLKKTGSAGFVLPDSIIINEGYKTIRHALTQKKIYP